MINDKLSEKEKQTSNLFERQRFLKNRKLKLKHTTNGRLKKKYEAHLLHKGFRHGFEIKGRWDPNNKSERRHYEKLQK